MKGTESNSSSGFKEPRFHNLAHRFAPMVERASAARRVKHRHHHQHKKTDKKQTSDHHENNKKQFSNSTLKTNQDQKHWKK